MHNTNNPLFSRQIIKSNCFYLDHASTRLPLTVHAGGWEVCCGDYVIERTGFKWRGIELIAEGQAEVTLNGKTTTAGAGSYFCYGPHTPHKISAVRGSMLKKYFVDFSGPGTKSFLKRAGLSDRSISETYMLPEILSLFDELILHGCSLRPSAGDVCRSLLECLGYLFNETNNQNQDKDGFLLYQKIRKYIDENALTIVSLGQIGSTVHKSREYCCRLFSQYSGDTPWNYLLRRKMNYAASLLRDPEVLVRNVSERLGYADQYRFSRVFKKIIGKSPVQMRRYT